MAANSGLSQLRLMIAGELSPPSMAATLNFGLVSAEEGHVVFAGEPTTAMLNPMGTVHGGWAATILDSALGCAVHSTLAPGEGYATLELKVNLTKAILPGRGALSATGTIITRGRRVATAEARLTDAAGATYAFGTTTCLIDRR